MTKETTERHPLDIPVDELYPDRVASKQTTPKIAITSAMAAEGLAAFRAVAARHGFDGILACGFIHNAVASAYLAMEMQRAGLPRREDW